MPFIITALVVFLLDQGSKLLALHALKPVGSVEIFPGFFRLYYATNTGGAFSILSDHTAILILFSLIAAVVILVWHFSLPPADWAMQISLGMIFGGAVGNLVDRIFRGYVIDFFDCHWRYQAHWPTFNISDSFICIGVGLIIFFTVFPKAHLKLTGVPQKRSDVKDGSDTMPPE